MPCYYKLTNGYMKKAFENAVKTALIITVAGCGHVKSPSGQNGLARHSYFEDSGANAFEVNGFDSSFDELFNSLDQTLNNLSQAEPAGFFDNNTSVFYTTDWHHTPFYGRAKEHSVFEADTASSSSDTDSSSTDSSDTDSEGVYAGYYDFRTDRESGFVPMNYCGKSDLEQLGSSEAKKVIFRTFFDDLDKARNAVEFKRVCKNFVSPLITLHRILVKEIVRDCPFSTIETTHSKEAQKRALQRIIKDWGLITERALNAWQAKEQELAWLKGKVSLQSIFLTANPELNEIAGLLSPSEFQQQEMDFVDELYSDIPINQDIPAGAFFSARQTLSGTTEQVLGYNFGRHAVQTRLVGFTGKTDTSNTKLMDTTYNFTAGKGYGFIRSQFASGSKALEVAGFDAHNTNFLTMQSVGYVYGGKAFQPFVAANYLTVSSKTSSAFGNHTSKTNTVFGVQAGVQSNYALTKNLSFKGFAMWQGNLNNNGAITKQLGANMMKVDAGLHYSKNNINAGVGYSVSHFGKTRHGFNLKLGVSF